MAISTGERCLRKDNSGIQEHNRTYQDRLMNTTSGFCGKLLSDGDVDAGCGIQEFVVLPYAKITIDETRRYHRRSHRLSSGHFPTRDFSDLERLSTSLEVHAPQRSSVVVRPCRPSGQANKQDDRVVVIWHCGIQAGTTYLSNLLGFELQRSSTPDAQLVPLNNGRHGQSIASKK